MWLLSAVSIDSPLEAFHGTCLNLESSSLHFNGHFQEHWVSRYQKVSIQDFIGAKGDEVGGDNWSYKSCKTPVKSAPATAPKDEALKSGA